MVRATVVVLWLVGCASDGLGEGSSPVEASQACRAQAELWCEGAAECDEDTLISGPSAVPRCVKGVETQCLKAMTREPSEAEQQACLDALASQPCSSSYGLPSECAELWGVR
jgi:hypothetical protein